MYEGKCSGGCSITGSRWWTEWPHLYDVNGAVLVVGAHPLVDEDALVQLAPQPPDQRLHREVRGRPVGRGDRPAAQGLQHLRQRPVARLLDLA